MGLPTLVMVTTPGNLKSLFTAPGHALHAGEANASAFGPVVGTRTHFVLDEESAPGPPPAAAASVSRRAHA